MNTRTKQEYVQAIYHRCRGARGPERRPILDEFREVTQPHRTHAIRLPNGPAPGVARPPRQVTDTILRPTAFSPMK